MSDYGCKLKTICDQPAVIGLHKNHRLLGASFETFSITQLAIKPHPSFCDFLSQAEINELFLTFASRISSSTHVFFQHNHINLLMKHASHGSCNSSCGMTDPQIMVLTQMVMEKAVVALSTLL